MIKATLLIFVSLLVIGCNRVNSGAQSKNVAEHTSNSMFYDLTQEDSIIVNGYGTEKVHIGMSKEELIQVMGKPNNEFPLSTSCNRSILQWYKSFPDGKVEDGNGVISYLKNDVVYEINFSSPRFKTKKDISYGSKLSSLLKVLDAKNFFQLTRSSSEATNDELVVYGIDNQNGLAYELGRDSKNKRIINGIYVFSSLNGFQPNGCLGNDQSFINITVK